MDQSEQFDTPSVVHPFVWCTPIEDMSSGSSTWRAVRAGVRHPPPEGIPDGGSDQKGTVLTEPAQLCPPQGIEQFSNLPSPRMSQTQSQDFSTWSHTKVRLQASVGCSSNYLDPGSTGSVLLTCSSLSPQAQRNGKRSLMGGASSKIRRKICFPWSSASASSTDQDSRIQV